jgi:peptidoglycan/LPS O-acetylase OafA/YrhL
MRRSPDTIAQIPKRFYSLDVLRGFAALSVVLWHWQHFFYRCTPLPYEMTKQPLYNIFSLFYQKGSMAVALFFSISGFVFFWLYAGEIFQKKISGWNFFLLRFSRLYPLHFLTLIVVLAGQITSMHLFGCYTIYQYNDVYDFFLNIFMASSWGFEKGLSFNGPVWSVSIEVLLYFLFFFYSKLGFARSWLITGIVIGGSIFIHFLPHIITQGIFSFFIGGAVFLFYKKIISYNSKRLLWICLVMTVLLWVITLAEFRYEAVSAFFDKINFFHTHHKVIDLAFIYFPTTVLFPMSLMSLALIETFRGTFGSRIRVIGDITYSSYLLHFPLQLIFILVLSRFRLSVDFFYTMPIFLIYFIVLLSLSLLSYNYFERPLQKYIRNKFLKKKQTV